MKNKVLLFILGFVAGVGIYSIINSFLPEYVTYNFKRNLRLTLVPFPKRAAQFDSFLDKIIIRNENDTLPVLPYLIASLEGASIDPSCLEKCDHMSTAVLEKVENYIFEQEYKTLLARIPKDTADFYKKRIKLCDEFLEETKNLQQEKEELIALIKSELRNYKAAILPDIDPNNETCKKAQLTLENVKQYFNKQFVYRATIQGTKKACETFFNRLK